MCCDFMQYIEAFSLSCMEYRSEYVTLDICWLNLVILCAQI